MPKTLTKADLVDAVYAVVNKTRPEAKFMVEEVLRILAEGLCTDGSVLISGFGRFSVRRKAARLARNPKTAEKVLLPPRTVVVFHLSRRFRDQLNAYRP